MTNNTVNGQWITIVLITAVLMLVFLVFYGNRTPSTATPNPNIEKPSVEKSASPMAPAAPTTL